MMTKSTTRYCVIAAPGYFGGNKSDVWSAHLTLEAAIRACRGSGSAVVVAADAAKSDFIWGDTIGRQYPILYRGAS